LQSSVIIYFQLEFKKMSSCRW